MAKGKDKKGGKRKVGRPSLYRPVYCHRLIEHMRDGPSYESFAAVVGVNVDTLYAWEAAHPEFSEAKKAAFALNLLYWDRLGVELASGARHGNAAAYIFNMKNRHFGPHTQRWKDRHELTGDPENPIHLGGEGVMLILPANGFEDPQTVAIPEPAPPKKAPKPKVE